MGAREEGTLGRTCRTPRHWIQTICVADTQYSKARAHMLQSSAKRTDLSPSFTTIIASRRSSRFAHPTPLRRPFAKGDPSAQPDHKRVSGPGPPNRLFDEEGFLLQLAGLHFVAHPARGSAPARPSQLGIFLAPILGSNFATFQRRPSSPARFAATLASVADISARKPRELFLKVSRTFANRSANAVAQLYKGIKGH